MDNRQLADTIKELRHRYSWSQSHLAEAAGLSVRTIQRLEKEGACSRETLLSVAAAFDVDVTTLTALISSETDASNLNTRSAPPGKKKPELLFSLRGWFSNRRPEWHQIMAIAGGTLLILPGSIVLIGILKYTLGFEAIPDPYEPFYTAEGGLQIWNAVSPVVFLGSLLLATGLNLLPFLDLEIANRESRLLGRISYNGNIWNRAVLGVGLLVIGVMLGYVAIEHIAEDAIRSVLN